MLEAVESVPEGVCSLAQWLIAGRAQAELAGKDDGVDGGRDSRPPQVPAQGSAGRTAAEPTIGA